MCVQYIYINYNMYTSTFRGVVLCMFSGNFSRGMLIVAFNRERWLEASWTKTSWFLDFHMFDFFPSIFDPSLIHVPFPRPVAQLRSHKLEPIILQPRTPRPLSAGRGNSKGGGRPSWVVFIPSWLVKNMKKHDYFNVSNSSSLLYQIVGFGAIK